MLDLILSCFSYIPEMCSVCCIGFKTFCLRELVCFRTNLTGSVIIFWPLFSSATTVVVIIVVSGDSVSDVSAVASRSNLSASSLLFRSFQLAMIFVLFRFLQWWHGGLGVSAFEWVTRWLTVLTCSSFSGFQIVQLVPSQGV